MSETSPNNYFFLNRDARWPHFSYSGIDLCSDGTLQLSSVPLLATALPDTVKSAPTPDGPAGIAADCTGALYFTEPVSNRLMCINACDGSVGPTSCVRGGESGSPGQLHTPRGLLIPADRRVLFVVDSGNHRIQIFDLDTFQLLEIWGGSGAGAAPASGSQPGRFNTPWTLASDSSGNVYVVDYGNQRVQKFNVLGEVFPSFAEKVAASGLIHQPEDIAIASFEGKIWIFVLDLPSARILLFDDAGNPILDSGGKPIVISDSHLVQPMGMAISGDALYVGDNAARRIFRFRIGDTVEFVGEAIGYDGTVAALFLDSKGTLWVHPGASLTPLALATRSGFHTLGSLWHPEPIRVVGRKVVWHRLMALLEPLSPNAHLDLFAHVSDRSTDFPGVDPTAANPFQDSRWQSIPSLANLDLTDIYIGGAQSKFLWVGALFSGDGLATPLLHQLRVEFDWPTFDQFLPAIYQNTGKCGDFLLRLLSLFQGFFGGIEQEIASIPALFDPFASPTTFLPWLAGCLGLDLDQSWGESKQREITDKIFEYYGKRGTPTGLREALRLFAGVNAVIDEPTLNAAWWALPGTAESCCNTCGCQTADNGESWDGTGNSILGWTTMLPPAQPQGAVVGTSADLDQSHLIADTDFGAPLFTDVAYQFRVGVYRSQVMSADALSKVRAVLDSEKPAHTLYDLCIIEPLFRVGFQGRLGIDTVVGGPPRSLALGSGQALGVDTALAGAAASRLGDESRLGVSTRLA
jgi:phage tail-like protein